MFENPDFVDPSTMKGKDPYLYDYNSWSPCIDNGDPEHDDGLSRQGGGGRG